MKKILFLFIAIFNLNAAVASDITVTATAATSGNNGQLFIEIDPSITDFPFLLTITYPNGFVHEVSINTHTYTLPGLDDGNYTVTLTTANGCSSIVSVMVQRCRYWKGRYMCYAIAEPYPHPVKDVAMIVVVDPPIKVISTATDANQFSYELYHPDPERVPSTVLDNVHGTSIQLVSEVIDYGSTKYDVASQDVIETDAMFVIKFSEFGEIEWIYHNYEGREKENPKDSKGREGGVENGQDGFGGVFPNPATQTAEYQFTCESAGSAILLMTDMLGREIQREQIAVGEGNNTHQIEGLERIPNGMYQLNIVQNDKIQSTERIVVQH